MNKDGNTDTDNRCKCMDYEAHEGQLLVASYGPFNFAFAKGDKLTVREWANGGEYSTPAHPVPAELDCFVVTDGTSFDNKQYRQ
jgi:hypothetical protein